MDVNGQRFQVSYISGDSDSGLFGGNRWELKVNIHSIVALMFVAIGEDQFG
jgi:hypothetical protein